VDVGIGGGRVETQAGQAIKHRVQQDLRLQPGQVHAQAGMRSVAERDVLLGITEDVEGVGIGVPGGVTVRGAQRYRDEGALGNADAAQFQVLGGHAHDDQRRGLPPQRFGYRLRYQAPVGADGVKLARVGEQAEQQAAG